MNKPEKFIVLLQELRNCYLPYDTTMSKCSTEGCYNFAISSLCSSCLESQIAELLDCSYMAGNVHCAVKLEYRHVKRAMETLDGEA